VRWQHPRRGLLVPEQFLPAVEQSELIGQFTMYVLELSIGVAARWRQDGIDVPISVNLSARSLSDQRLPADVERLLLRYGYPPARLVLEITESVVVSPMPVIDEVLAGLRQLGVQLAVDDFGTGYSSLTFLTRVAVDEVKVDKAFVARMVDFPEAAAIVRTTVDLARQLGLRVTAEGVETAEQRAALAALGCTAGQGYHFFPPVPPERATRILQELKATNVRHLRAEGTG
jgi:EAL domain-containing protein (putative c-di-GMP-specific phosphodiesterase class I)